MIETLYDTQRSAHESAGSASLRELTRRYEARVVEDVLNQTRWNVSAAARRLGLSRVGLTKKLKTLGLVRPPSC